MAQTEGGIEEVIVTANKRSENVQNVSMSVTAIGGEALEARGILNAKGLAEAIPAVKIQGSNMPAVFVRGVGSSNSSTTGDQGVAIHLDGIFHARPTAFGAGFLDVDRVEVLKGPQGTLYGRGALGGNINVISKAPTQNYEGSANFELGTYSLVRGGGVLNLPLTDKLAMRAAVELERHDGYSSNGGDDADNLAARLRLKYDASENLEFGLIGFYSSQKGKGATSHLTRSYPGLPRSSDPWRSDIPGSAYSLDQSTKEVSGSAKLDLGFGTLTYIPGWVNSTSRYLEPRIAASGATVTFPQFASDLRGVSTTNEVRLDSAPGSRFEWTVGGFRMFEKLRYVVFNRATYGRITTGSTSVFGQAGYALNDQFKIIAGGRLTQEKKDQRNNLNYHYTGEWKPKTGKVGVEYRPVEASMIYATVSSGFKSGGFFTAPAPNSFGPEKVVTFELGSKNRFLENRLQLNGAVYRYNYDDYTVNASVPGYNGATAQGVFNAGKVEITGAELEAIYRFTQTDRLEFSAAYTHGEFKTFKITVTTGAAGDRVPFSAEWSGNVAYQHDFKFANGAELAARIDSHLETSTWLSLNHRAQTRQPGYMKSNATLTYTPAEGAYRISGWVRNLEDRDVKLTVNDTLNYETYILAPPRTAGVTLSAAF